MNGMCGQSEEGGRVAERLQNRFARNSGRAQILGCLRICAAGSVIQQTEFADKVVLVDIAEQDRCAFGVCFADRRRTFENQVEAVGRIAFSQ